jgi:hypothetical protein
VGVAGLISKIFTLLGLLYAAVTIWRTQRREVGRMINWNGSGRKRLQSNRYLISDQSMWHVENTAAMSQSTSEYFEVSLPTINPPTLRFRIYHSRLVCDVSNKGLNLTAPQEEKNTYPILVTYNWPSLQNTRQKDTYAQHGITSSKLQWVHKYCLLHVNQNTHMNAMACRILRWTQRISNWCAKSRISSVAINYWRSY